MQRPVWWWGWPFPWGLLMAQGRFGSPCLYGVFDQSGQVCACMQDGSLVIIYTQRLFPGLSFPHAGAAITLCAGQSPCRGWGRAGFEGAGSIGGALCASPPFGWVAWDSAYHRSRVAAAHGPGNKCRLREIPNQRRVPHPFCCARRVRAFPGAAILGAPTSSAVGGESFTYMGGASGNFIK